MKEIISEVKDNTKQINYSSSRESERIDLITVWMEITADM